MEAGDDASAEPETVIELQPETVISQVKVSSHGRGQNRSHHRRRPRNPHYKKPDLEFNEPSETGALSYVYTPAVEQNNTLISEPLLIIPLNRSEEASTIKPPYSHEFAERQAKRVERKSLEVAIHHEIVRHKVEQQQRMIAEIIKQREIDVESVPIVQNPAS